MNKTVIYIHGKGGNTSEAAHYAPLFPDSHVIGLDYHAATPWEAAEEFPGLWNAMEKETSPASVTVIANSIGAYFALHALADKPIKTAFLISPVVDMEKLITDMMIGSHVTESELQQRKQIETAFGETLSWDYLCYVRNHPIHWTAPTHILFGENDNLTSFDTVSTFAQTVGGTLDVMRGGEHWFHTPEQMRFLDDWLRKYCPPVAQK